MIPDWNLDFLVTNSQRWISAQREKYRPAAKPLSPIELSALNSIFGPETLEAARVVRIPEIENPDFYTQLSSVPLDFRPMAGITYRDTILVSESRVPTPTPIVLLFHEPHDGCPTHGYVSRDTPEYRPCLIGFKPPGSSFPPS